MLVPLNWCKKHQIALVPSNNSPTILATTAPHNEFLKAIVESEIDQRVQVVTYHEKEIEKFYTENKLVSNSNPINTQKSKKNDWESQPTIELVEQIIDSAVIEGVSDIHLEPQENILSIRFRKDGILLPHLELPYWLHEKITLRLKVLAQLDISEKRLPLDGRFNFKSKSKEIHIRISTLPTRYGEKVVLRLLLKNNFNFSLFHLKMPEDILQKIKEIIYKPQGIFFVTGPTGSGKTTTIYAALQEIIQRQINVTTLEDPIEYDLIGANQVLMLNKAGLDFSVALRSILRQDPDVIFIGEIRDSETAKIAIQAAQTGHLVLSTLHTNDAASAIDRLKDLGVSPHLISESLLGILAQRLVRKSCLWCQSKGCPKCKGVGYQGRFALFELLVPDSEFKDCLFTKNTSSEILKRMRYLKLRDYGEQALEKGETSLLELKRVLG